MELSPVLKEGLAFCEHRLREEGVDLELDAEDGLIVEGDQGELQQAFLNLFLNALDAMKNSAARKLGVRARREGKTVLVEIADTGGGMTADELDHAFDLFYTARGAEGGTGLGLAIVHTIVTNHGGRVELQSEPNRGTCARVVLPAEEGA